MHRLLTTVLDSPTCGCCATGRVPALLVGLAVAKLDAVLADRQRRPAATQNHQPVAQHQRRGLVYARCRQTRRAALPKSLAVVPVLPTDHAAMRARIDHWF